MADGSTHHVLFVYRCVSLLHYYPDLQIRILRWPVEILLLPPHHLVKRQEIKPVAVQRPMLLPASSVSLSNEVSDLMVLAPSATTYVSASDGDAAGRSDGNISSAATTTTTDRVESAAITTREGGPTTSLGEEVSANETMAPQSIHACPPALVVVTSMDPQRAPPGHRRPPGMPPRGTITVATTAITPTKRFRPPPGLPPRHHHGDRALAFPTLLSPCEGCAAPFILCGLPGAPAFMTIPPSPPGLLPPMVEAVHRPPPGLPPRSRHAAQGPLSGLSPPILIRPPPGLRRMTCYGHRHWTIPMVFNDQEMINFFDECEISQENIR